MSLMTRCAECKRKLNVSESLIEKSIKCPRCGHKMVVHRADVAPGAAEVNDSGELELEPVKKKPVAAAAAQADENSTATTAKPPKPGRKAASDFVDELPPLKSARDETEMPPDEPPAGAVTAKKPPAPRPSSRDDDADEDDEERRLSPWAALAFVLAALAAVQIFWPSMFWLTVGLAGVGAAFAVLGLILGLKKLRGLDWTLLGLGALTSAGLLLLAFYQPGLLNMTWAPAPVIDLQKMVCVPRKHPMREGKPLAADDWVDALTDAIRQEDIVVKLEAVEVKGLAERPAQYLTIYLRLANLGRDQPIPVKKITKESLAPVVMDEAGRPYAFIEEWPRKPDRNGIRFDINFAKPAHMMPTFYQDQLLVYEAPAAPVALKLEISAAIWGRQGRCKFRVEKYFP